MLFASIIIADIQMDVQLLRGIIMYKRKKIIHITPTDTDAFGCNTIWFW